MKKIKLQDQYRTLSVKSGDINEENRTVDLSFSSEEPVERWFGGEILDHKKSSVNLSRLNDGAAVLVDHQGDQVGVVETANIKEKRGLARLRFSKNGRGSEVFQDITDGIRRNVSFGYRVNNLVLEKSSSEENPVYRSTDWQPFEISIVGVPADQTIGIGRSKVCENEIEVEDSFRTLDDDSQLIEEQLIDNKGIVCNVREKILLLKGKSLSKQVKSLGKEA